MTTHDFLRSRLEPQEPLKLQQLRQSEWSNEFEQLMRNRLCIGAYRYGKLNDKNKSQVDRVAYIRRKLQQYEETGNTEMLVDIANLALVEFVEGSHPKKHFKAEDRI